MIKILKKEAAADYSLTKPELIYRCWENEVIPLQLFHLQIPTFWQVGDSPQSRPQSISGNRKIGQKITEIGSK